LQSVDTADQVLRDRPSTIISETPRNDYSRNDYFRAANHDF